MSCRHTIVSMDTPRKVLFHSVPSAVAYKAVLYVMKLNQNRAAHRLLMAESSVHGMLVAPSTRIPLLSFPTPENEQEVVCNLKFFFNYSFLKIFLISVVQYQKIPEKTESIHQSRGLERLFVALFFSPIKKNKTKNFFLKKTPQPWFQ